MFRSTNKLIKSYIDTCDRMKVSNDLPEKDVIFYTTSVGQRKTLSPRRESDPCMTFLAKSFPVAQWLERPNRVRKVRSFIPFGRRLTFFRCPTLVTYRISRLSYFFSELKIYYLSLLFYNRLTCTPQGPKKKTDDLVRTVEPG